MERYAEYILGLDVAAVISAVLIFFFGNLQAETVFLLATQMIFTLVILALAFTFLYYLQLGKNNWLLMPSLVILAIGAAITFFSWFIGGVISLIALFFLLLCKDIAGDEKRGVILSYVGFALLAVMPPLGAFLSLQFGVLDYMVLSLGTILVIVGVVLTIRSRKHVETVSVGFLLLTLSFLFLAPSHELLSIHANGSYGVYDLTIISMASLVFFVFFANILVYRLAERKVIEDIENGYKLLRKGKYKEAVEHFRRAYKALPDDERVLNGLGLALMKMGNYKESEEYLRKLVRISNDKVYKTNLGNLYFRSGRIDKAMEIYQEVLKEDPHFYNALNNLARCYMEKGEYEKARELLEKAIEVDQDKKAAKVNYYFLLTAMGMDEEASKYKSQLGGLVE